LCSKTVYPPPPTPPKVAAPIEKTDAVSGDVKPTAKKKTTKGVLGKKTLSPSATGVALGGSGSGLSIPK